MIYGSLSDYLMQPSLFGIHAQIREKIFNQVLLGTEKIKICMSCDPACNRADYNYGAASVVDKFLRPGILSVCVQAYSECVTICYRDNRFTVEGCATDTDEFAVVWLEILPAGKRDMIRHIAIDGDRRPIFGVNGAHGWLQDTFFTLSEEGLFEDAGAIFLNCQDTCCSDPAMMCNPEGHELNLRQLEDLDEAKQLP